MTPLFDERLSLRDRAIWALHEWGLTSKEIASLCAGDFVVHRRIDAFSVRLRAQDQAPARSTRVTTVTLLGAHRRTVERYLESIAPHGLRPASPAFPGRREGRPMDGSSVRKILRLVGEISQDAAG